MSTKKTKTTMPDQSELDALFNAFDFRSELNLLLKERLAENNGVYIGLHPASLINHIVTNHKAVLSAHLKDVDLYNELWVWLDVRKLLIKEMIKRGMIYHETEPYPVLHQNTDEAMVMVTEEFLHFYIESYQPNAAIQQDINKFLRDNHLPELQNVPDVVAPTDQQAREAMSEAVFNLLYETPKKFPRQMLSAIENAGYDVSGMKVKDIERLVRDILKV